jgi:hypothetical protein
MTKKFWKVHGQVKLRPFGTQAYEYADAGEILEEIVPGTTDGRDEVRVFRSSEKHTIQSYIVSREELEANTTPVSE